MDVLSIFGASPDHREGRGTGLAGVLMANSAFSSIFARQAGGDAGDAP